MPSAINLASSLSLEKVLALSVSAGTFGQHRDVVVGVDGECGHAAFLPAATASRVSHSSLRMRKTSSLVCRHEAKSVHGFRALPEIDVPAASTFGIRRPARTRARLRRQRGDRRLKAPSFAEHLRLRALT